MSDKQLKCEAHAKMSLKIAEAKKDMLLLQELLQQKPSAGDWEPIILDKPLDKVPNYVQECIERSAGAEYCIVYTPEGDICHTGNGPTSLVNAQWIAACTSDRIGRLLEEMDRLQKQHKKVCNLLKDINTELLSSSTTS